MATQGWRPFWLHQVGEYIIGFALVAAAVQSLEPAIPTLAGGLIVVNAALVDGPLGAWRGVSRRQHRIVDVVVGAVVALAALMPFLAIDNVMRLMMIGAVVVMGFLWATTSFAPRPARSPTTAARPDRSESIGRTAGRLVNRGRELVRKQQGE
jgi:hypothetical protein